MSLGWRRGLGWALALLILGSCLWLLDLEQIRTSLARLGFWQVLGLLLLLTLDRLLMAWKWGLLLRLGDIDMPFGRLVAILYEGSFAGTFLPSQIGGDLLRAWRLGEAGHPAEPALASLVMERMLGLLSALSLGGIGSGLLLAWLHPEAAAIWLGLTLLGLLLLHGLFWGLLRASWQRRLLAWLERPGGGRARGLLARLQAAFLRLGHAPWKLGLNFLLTMAEHLLQALIVLLTALALGIEALSMAFIAATLAQMVLARLPIAPDGWGIAELGAIGVYGLIGIAAAPAFTLSVTGHVLVLLALLPGAFFLLRHTGRRGNGVTT